MHFEGVRIFMRPDILSIKILYRYINMYIVKYINVSNKNKLKTKNGMFSTELFYLLLRM